MIHKLNEKNIIVEVGRQNLVTGQQKKDKLLANNVE